MGTTMGTPHTGPQPDRVGKTTLEELQAIRREIAALRRLVDEFAGVLLNAKFPFGKPVDRWRRG